MSWLDAFRKKVAEMPDDADPGAVFAALAGTTPAAGATPAPSVTPAPAPTQDSKVASLEAELARERAKGILRDAALFADRVIEKEQRAFPSERDAIISAYSQAAQDDLAFGPVTFANGTPGNRVAVLTATYEARPAHILTEEQLRTDVRALYNRTETPNPNDPKPPSPERIAELLKATPLGSQVLAARNGN